MIEEYRVKIEPKVLQVWESMILNNNRRFFNENLNLLNTMRRVYMEICAKVRSVSWFKFGAMQTPTDFIMYTEVIEETRPRVIIETGTAAGNCAKFYDEVLKRIHGDDNYLIITIERFPHTETLDSLKNYKNIISLIGDSTSNDIIEQVKNKIPVQWPVMVTLDSDHGAEHVMAELTAYAGLVSHGCYCIVQDSYLGLYWGGNLEDHEQLAIINGDTTGRQFDYIGSPLGAVEAFLQVHDEFNIDMDKQRWLITQHPYGWLKRIV